MESAFERSSRPSGVRSVPRSFCPNPPVPDSAREPGPLVALAEFWDGTEVPIFSSEHQIPPFIRNIGLTINIGFTRCST